MIVGTAGPIASGKSILAEVLISKGFIRRTVSDEVREETRKRGLAIERNEMQKLGNEMREKHGKGYWAKRLIAKLDLKKNYVVEGIRNPGEVEEFKKLRNFILVGVNAPVEKRLQWILKRNKDSDPKTLKLIKEMEARDRGKGEETFGQQVDECFAMADYFIDNDSTLEELRARVEELAEELCK